MAMKLENEYDIGAVMVGQLPHMPSIFSSYLLDLSFSLHSLHISEGDVMGEKEVSLGGSLQGSATVQQVRSCALLAFFLS